MKNRRYSPKSNLANVVKSESLKNILKIQNRGRRGRRAKNGEQSIGELDVDDGLDELAQRSGAKLVARNLALKFPAVAVGVEDAVAEKIGESRAKGVSFLVDVEVGLEDVVDGGGISGENLPLPEQAVEGEGGGRGDLEKVGEPLQTAVPVGKYGEEGTH